MLKKVFLEMKIKQVMPKVSNIKQLLDSGLLDIDLVSNKLIDYKLVNYLNYIGR